MKDSALRLYRPECAVRLFIGASHAVEEGSNLVASACQLGGGGYGLYERDRIHDGEGEKMQVQLRQRFNESRTSDE